MGKYKKISETFFVSKTETLIFFFNSCKTCIDSAVKGPSVIMNL